MLTRTPVLVQQFQRNGHIRGGSRVAATSKMERFVITVNGLNRVFKEGCNCWMNSASDIFLLKLFLEISLTSIRKSSEETS